MIFPQSLQEKLNEALSLIEAAIQERINNGDTVEDLVRFKKELLEIKSGVRKTPSAELSRSVIDSMDWNLPYIRKFFEVSELVKKYLQSIEKK